MLFIKQEPSVLISHRSKLHKFFCTGIIPVSHVDNDINDNSTSANIVHGISITSHIVREVIDCDSTHFILLLLVSLPQFLMVLKLLMPRGLFSKFLE